MSAQLHGMPLYLNAIALQQPFRALANLPHTYHAEQSHAGVAAHRGRRTELAQTGITVVRSDSSERLKPNLQERAHGVALS